MTVFQLQDEVAKGGKFVVFKYCLSPLLFSFRNSSCTYLVRHNENAFKKSMPFTVISLLFGWWGIPWGPLHTFACLISNIKGGKDVTAETMHYVHQATKGHVFEFEHASSLAY